MDEVPAKRPHRADNSAARQRLTFGPPKVHDHDKLQHNVISTSVTAS